MPHEAIRRFVLALALAVPAVMAGAASAALVYPGYGNDMVESHPPYLTYYYTSPPVTDEYSTAPPGYYRYAYPGDTSTRNTNTSPRCAALSGAAYVDCLHGAAPGG